jgi:hypothetical protein
MRLRHAHQRAGQYTTLLDSTERRPPGLLATGSVALDLDMAAACSSGGGTVALLPGDRDCARPPRMVEPTLGRPACHGHLARRTQFRIPAATGLVALHGVTPALVLLATFASLRWGEATALVHAAWTWGSFGHALWTDFDRAGLPRVTVAFPEALLAWTPGTHELQIPPGLLLIVVMTLIRPVLSISDHKARSRQLWERFRLRFFTNTSGRRTIL